MIDYLPRPGEPVLSVRQPWAWLIVRPDLDGLSRLSAAMRGEIKDVENRTWGTSFRGALWIQAARTCSRLDYDHAVAVARRAGVRPEAVPRLEDMPRGAIVGRVMVSACVRPATGPWGMGDYGIVLAHTDYLQNPVPCHGALGIFKYRTA